VWQHAKVFQSLSITYIPFQIFKIKQWAAEPRQAASLQAIDGSDTQDVGKQSHYVFGRDSAESTILIDDPSVSRRHAAIVHHKDGRIYIIDLASVRLE
jgi:pSer/pThr/pTyr-binding forkhead associated (FHA) protein